MILEVETDSGLSCLALSAARWIESSVFCQFWPCVIGGIYYIHGHHSSTWRSVRWWRLIRDTTICHTYWRVKMSASFEGCEVFRFKVLRGDNMVTANAWMWILTIWFQIFGLSWWFVVARRWEVDPDVEMDTSVIVITFQSFKILPHGILKHCAVFQCLTDIHSHASITQTGLLHLYFFISSLNEAGPRQCSPLCFSNAAFGLKCPVTAVHLPVPFI